MKILLVRQPWAGLIVLGHKTVENRSWKTMYRGPVRICASKRPDDVSADDIKRRFDIALDYNELLLGGIIGITEIVDCVRDSNSQWAQPVHWHFLLANSRPLPFNHATELILTALERSEAALRRRRTN